MRMREIMNVITEATEGETWAPEAGQIVGLGSRDDLRWFYVTKVSKDGQKVYGRYRLDTGQWAKSITWLWRHAIPDQNTLNAAEPPPPPREPTGQPAEVPAAKSKSKSPTRTGKGNGSGRLTKREAEELRKDDELAAKQLGITYQEFVDQRSARHRERMRGTTFRDQ